MDYSRHWRQIHARTIALEGFTPEAVQQLGSARILAVGAGGLGSACLPLLLSQGVGHVTLYEFDAVSPSNLPRQLLYTPGDVDRPKAQIAKERLLQKAPWADVTIHQEPFPPKDLDCATGCHFDLAIDCSDNHRTAFALNSYCRQQALPLLWGGVEGYVGQVALLHGKQQIDLEDIIPKESIQTPTAPAVFAPAVQVMGALMAGEAVKYLLRLEPSLDGAMLHVNLKSYAFHLLTLTPTERKG